MKAELRRAEDVLHEPDTFLSPTGYPLPTVLKVFPDLLVRGSRFTDRHDDIAFTSGGHAYAVEVGPDESGAAEEDRLVYSVTILRNFSQYEEDREPGWDLADMVYNLDAVNEWQGLDPHTAAELAHWLRINVLKLRLELTT